MRKGCRKLPIYCLQGAHHKLPGAFLLRTSIKVKGSPNFKVDGKIIRNKSFPVGLMDVLSIEKMNKHFRILPDSHHGLILHEIPEEESNFKLCRINNKTTIKGGHVQLNLHDGRNILINVKDPRTPKEDSYRRMDVLKISTPEQEIIKHLKFKEGHLAIIISGKNIGQVFCRYWRWRFDTNSKAASISGGCWHRW